jgi:integrase
VKGYNAEKDRRHDRRTISIEELRRLIEAAQAGPVVLRVPGPLRALCYRLAVSTGLRYSEIASITTASFNWGASSVTVAAAYTKNGDPATLPLPEDLAVDLKAYVATRPTGEPVFLLPPYGKGAQMLRVDLKAADIPYRDASGLVFDFHSLRCETATLADQAGVSPRVVQKMMRHSSLELTGRYTRPRAVDIEAAASLLPSLKPEGDRPEALAATGTDSGTVRYPCAADVDAPGEAPGRNPNQRNAITSSSAGPFQRHPDPVNGR